MFKQRRLLVRKNHAAKTWLAVGLCLTFCGVIIFITTIAWFVKEYVSIVTAAQLDAYMIQAASFQQACSGQSNELAGDGEGQVLGSIDALDISPVTVAPTELHRYASLNKTFYMMSAYHEPRFLPYVGAEPEERMILLMLADTAMRKGWVARNVPVQDGWNCLLCSFPRDINTGSPQYHGPPPTMQFKRPREDPLNCWWGSEANRSYQWFDLHGKNYNLGQLECKAPEGLPLDKISLSTVANEAWAKTGDLAEVLFAPLETFYAGIRKAAVPSFERFRLVHHMKYEKPHEAEPEADDDEDDDTPPKKPRISMCVGPVHSNGVPYVEEWVAYSQMMGVDYFHVYYWDNPIQETSRVLLQKLKYFQMKGIMTVYHLDMEFEDPTINKTGLEARPKAQATVVMDCYYRAAGKADFVGWIDMDEFLGPASVVHSTWTEALAPLFKDPTLGTLKFPHWWFQTEHQIKSSTFLHTELVTASVVAKDITALGYDPYGRTKCMARVGSVRMQCIHMPMILAPGYRIENVSTDIMYFRHYRGAGFLARNESVQDTSMLRFQEKLHFAVKDIRADLRRWGVYENLS